MRIAVLASGNGTNFERLSEACRQGQIPSSAVVCLITDRPCGAIERAARLNIPCLNINPNEFSNHEAWAESLLEALVKNRADFIILAGFLRKIPPNLIRSYPSKILNIHPALLPKFGGPGMYGRRVHEAVLRAQAKETGVTIHVVDEEYDHGPIVWQEKIPVLPSDTPQTLEERIHELERRAYPKAVAYYLKKLHTGMPRG